MSPDQEIILGILAGWWVCMAAIFMISIAGGMDEETRQKFPFAPKLLGGIFFPVSLW
jgi:hypothetical protein